MARHTVTPDERWTKAAACRGADTDLFFPVGSGERIEVQVGSAKAICSGCPVRAECLRWAEATGQLYGIFGGATEDERRAGRRAGVGQPAALRVLPPPIWDPPS